MKTEELQKKANGLLIKILACVGINLLAFLVLGFYLLGAKEKLDNSGVKEIEPTIYEVQLATIKIKAVVGLVVIFVPVVFCFKFASKRSRVLKELQLEEAKFIENFDLD